MIIIKTFDGIYATGTGETLREFSADFCKRFALGTFSHGLGIIRAFGLNFVQHEDF